MEIVQSFEKDSVIRSVSSVDRNEICSYPK